MVGLSAVIVLHASIPYRVGLKKSGPDLITLPLIRGVGMTICIWEYLHHTILHGDLSLLLPRGTSLPSLSILLFCHTPHLPLAHAIHPVRPLRHSASGSVVSVATDSNELRGQVTV